MRIGQLRHKLEIRVRTTSRNAHGEQVDDWTTVEATRRFGFENIKAKGIVAGKQYDEIASGKIHLRWYDGLTVNNHRFYWTARGRWFKIEHIASEGGVETDMVVSVKELTGEDPPAPS